MVGAQGDKLRRREGEKARRREGEKAEGCRIQLSTEGPKVPHCTRMCPSIF